MNMFKRPTKTSKRKFTTHHENCYSKAFFIKSLTPGLPCELCKPFDDWLESTNLTNYPADYIICGLSRELKNW